MEELINKSKQLTSLLIEYKNSLTFGNCTYQIDRQPDRDGRFFLIEIKTGQIVRDGTPDNLKAWLRLRKIEPDKVYNYSLMPLPIIKQENAF